MIIQLLTSDISSLQAYKSSTCPIVLLQNGVYAANMLAKWTQPRLLYALKNDCIASGLDIPSCIKLISHNEWVELCIQHQPSVTIQ